MQIYKELSILLLSVTSRILNMEVVNQPCAKTLEEYEKRMLALKDAIEILGGKWKFCILLNLNQYKSLRFSLLKEACRGITPKVLSGELHQLEENRLITRTVNTTKPVTVSYSMTEHAKETWPVLSTLIDFGFKHRKVILDK